VLWKFASLVKAGILCEGRAKAKTKDEKSPDLSELV